MKNETRTRNFSIVTYLSKNAIEGFLNSPFVKDYAYITHDSDVLEDGTPKTAHTHIVITFRDAKTFSSVNKMFLRLKAEYGANTLIEPCIDLKQCLRYLVHADNPEKFQYDGRLVVSTYKLDCYNIEDDYSPTEALLDDIINEVPLRVMVKRYGRDFVINYQKYATFAHMLFQEEHHLTLCQPTETTAEFDTLVFERNHLEIK